MDDRGDGAGLAYPATPQRFADRYIFGSVLKHGHGVDTYHAVDTRTGTDVVVKTIDASVIHATARLRFEHETYVLRQLSGTGLTGLLDAGVCDDLLYLVQPFVAGTTLQGRLALGPLGFADALRVGVAIAGALDIAHGAGVCHRDVKPANVVVDGEPIRVVTLIDFGFARSQWLDESIRDDLVGTVRYLAPESAGLLAVPADDRSDLYALGVLLFECLAGRPPFVGPGVGDLLRQHLSTPVPELRDLGLNFPRVIDAVLQRLLRKEPGERYQSAAAVAADLQRLLDATEAGDLDPKIIVGRLDRRHTLTDPAFVGRDAEFSALKVLLDSVQAGDSGLLLVEADSGGGKSRLLTELVLQAGGSGTAFLRGQAVAQAAQRPFTLLRGVAQDLVALFDGDEPGTRGLLERVGEAAATAVRALPDLAPLLGAPASEDAGPEQFGEQRSLAALHQLFASVSTPSRPVIIVLDDCQWADGLTLRLLSELFGAGGSPPPHLGVIAAFRSEEVPVDHPLRCIAQAGLVQLGTLSPEAMVQLAESMAGPLPEKAVATVVRLADGSPFMGTAVLRGLVECGALVGESAGWSVNEAALRDVQTTRRSAVFLVRRLELLSPHALRLLSAGAVLGKEFDVELSASLVGAQALAPSILEEARRRRLLWVDDRTGRCSFFHDKIREALLDRLEPEARRQLHASAAEALERAGVDDGRVFDLAYHHDAAGLHEAACPYALRAAELARGQHGLDAAVTHYRMADRGVHKADHGTRLRIAEGLGDVLTLQGVYAEAERQLTLARSLVEDRVHSAALEGKLGDVAFKQGDVPTARNHLEAAMRGLGRPIPRSIAVLFLWLLWELLIQTAHTVLPRLTARRTTPGRAGRAAEDVLAMRLHSRLAYLYWFHSGKIPCAWSHLRGLNLAERYPPSLELGQAWSEHAPVMTMLPWFARAVRYAERSLVVRRELGDVWGQGQSRGFAGVTLYAASRFDEGEEACREALRLLESTGDKWESNTAGWNLAMCLYRKGDLRQASEVAQEVYATATAIGDQTSAGVALSVWTRASGGRVDRQRIERELTQGREDASTTTELQLAAGLAALADDELDLALQHLDDAAATVARAGLRQEYVAPVFPWRATVVRMLAERASLHDPRRRRARLRSAHRATLRARFWAFSYRNNAPHAHREAALVASLRGRHRQANRLLHKSLETAQRQGAVYEAALTSAAMAELDVVRGGPMAPWESARAAVLELEVLAVPDPEVHSSTGSVSMFDRFTTLLAAGRDFTAASSFAAIESATRKAALALLRGERCHLVDVAALEDDHLVSLSGESVDGVSRTLLTRAVMSRTPVVADDSGADDSESLLLSGIRSVLAAPIMVHGEPRSCFYVTHRQIGQLFGEEEVQLAAFVATLAGAAYEHLAGSETRFRSLAQNSSDVLTLVDRDGVVSYQSSAADRVFALAGQGLRGTLITDWVHPDDLDRFNAALAEATREVEVRIECRFRRADGIYLFAETAVTNLLEDPTVGALVLNTRDVSDRRRLEDELRERALHDELTGLPNRALFLERLEHALRRRAPHNLVTCFLDLDDFKAVNDTLGHGAGDALLVAVAERLRECLRPGDTVARFGGDEFAVLLEDTDLATAIIVAQRILDQTAVPVLLGDTEIVPHTSIGIAPAGVSTTRPDHLLAEADTAMYAAKARGSHRYEIFQPAMRLATEHRSRMRTELDRALAGDELRLHYQPIVDLRTGHRRGVEALVRWQHPAGRLLPPKEFIKVAEDSGQIASLGQWVFRTACSDLVHLGPEIYMSVNVSARQLQLPNFVQSIAETLQDFDLPAPRLVLEITETAAVADLDGAIARLLELKALGLQLALDDFGTGYSPLSYLRRFPIDFLKIDRSFVQGVAARSEDRAIVRGVIDMAHALGLRTIAEGVEQADQHDVLRDLNCDLAQGYYWMAAVPLSSLPSAVVPGSREGAPEHATPVLE